MHLTHLQLVDFRSYHTLELTLEPGATVFIGSNGQGKTNLVEAVAYLATLASHRVAGDAPLVRVGADRSVIRARIARGDRAAVVEVEILPGKANRARLNRSPVPRPRDILGLLCTVLFAPEDLALVKGEPDRRRRFLDDLLVARTPRMAALRADYDRVLKQRSALLRTAGAARRGGGGAAADVRTLDVWDGHLAKLGAELLVARLALVHALRPRVERAYAALAGVDSSIGLDYRASTPLDGLRAGAPDPPQAPANPALPAAVTLGTGTPGEELISPSPSPSAPSAAALTPTPTPSAAPGSQGVGLTGPAHSRGTQGVGAEPPAEQPVETGESPGPRTGAGPPQAPPIPSDHRAPAAEVPTRAPSTVPVPPGLAHPAPSALAPGRNADAVPTRITPHPAERAQQPAASRDQHDPAATPAAPAAPAAPNADLSGPPGPPGPAAEPRPSAPGGTGVVAPARVDGRGGHRPGSVGPGDGAHPWAASAPAPDPAPAVPDRAAVEDAMLAELARLRGRELDRGVTLVGPHRDELTLSIGGLPARGYASHGESWSLALALELASFDLLRDDGREPVLLLDDVFAELDVSRRERLAELVSQAEQVLVTAAVGDDVPAGLADACFTVAGGRVDRAA